MFQVSIIKSTKKVRYYTGHTDNIQRRLKEHNAGRNKSTKAYIPWCLVYSESYATKNDAYEREMQIKSYKGGRAFKALVE